MKLTKKLEKIELKIRKNLKKEKKRGIQKRRKQKIKDIMKNIKKKFLIMTQSIVVNQKINKKLMIEEKEIFKI